MPDQTFANSDAFTNIYLLNESRIADDQSVCDRYFDFLACKKSRR